MAFTTELKSQFVQMLVKNKIAHKIGWANFMKTVNNPGAVVVDVANESELQCVIKEIKRLNSIQQEHKITAKATAGWDDSGSNLCCGFFPWKTAHEEAYNESFSFSQVVGGRTSPGSEGTDVIIRFKKKFHKAKVLGPTTTPPSWVNPHSPIHQLPSFLVEVSAGMQIGKFADFLRSNNLSLTTTSMISWVTMAGLSGTAGHGTGRDEPAFSGLIEAITVCDMDGNLREIKAGDPDFELLRGGHSGLLGVITSMKLRVVQAFNLKETVELFKDTQEMTGKLSAILQDNQYISFLGMPSSSDSVMSKETAKWQIRKWNYTDEKPTGASEPTYASGLNSLLQEIEIRLGDSAMEFLVNSELRHLLPSFLVLAAAESIGKRGTQEVINFENNITHPQVAFPKALRDVDYFIPVKDAEAGKILEAVLQRIEQLIAEAATRKEHPVTYAIYVRYLKGTNGGLSTSHTSSADERILAIDVVTHPNAPGIKQFEKDLMHAFKEMGLQVRTHLGKDFPEGIERYDQFLEPEAVNEFIQALERWHATPGKEDGAERLAQSPFYTPYLQKMLDLQPILVLQETQEEVPTPIKAPIHPEEYVPFLKRLYTTVEGLEVHCRAASDAKKEFLKACNAELNVRAPVDEQFTLDFVKI